MMKKSNSKKSHKKKGFISKAKRKVSSSTRGKISRVARAGAAAALQKASEELRRKN